MNLELTGQLATIVGGANGIGLAIAEAFAAEGAKVVLLDIDEQVHVAAQRIEQRYPTTASAMTCDAADDRSVRLAATRILTEHGRCDHLVFAAGIGSGKHGFPFWNLDPHDWRRVIDVNLLAAVNVAHAFAPAMVQAGQGCMLFLSSVAGQIGSQTDPPYSAAKAGLINFAQCAAKDLAPHGVRVNTICPGMVKTELNQSVWRAWYDRQPETERLPYDEWAERKIFAVTPLGRWQEAGDVAALAVFLASPRANNITGQTMNVDGGQVMHW